MGGREGRGTLEVRGEEGRETESGLEVERGRVVEPLERTGVGAWTCIEMARVGRAGRGNRPRLVRGTRGVVDWDDLEAGKGGESQGQYVMEGR